MLFVYFGNDSHLSHALIFIHIFQTKNVQTRTCHKQKAAIIYQRIT